MKPKSYRVFFANTSVGKEGLPLGPELRSVVADHGENLPALQLSGERFQMRELKRTGTVWQGSFVKLRDDAPHVVAADNKEHELELEDGDHIIEKCYFLLREAQNLIVWQANRSAGGLSRVEDYLSELLGMVTALPPVMNHGELDRVLNGKLYEVDFAYARPPMGANGLTPWDKKTFDMMNSVDAAHAKFTLRAPRGGHLGKAVKDFLKGLVKSPDAEKIRVKLTDETDPIELFMAPLRDKITVEMNGRYPQPKSVFEGLESAYDRHRAHLGKQP